MAVMEGTYLQLNLSTQHAILHRMLMFNLHRIKIDPERQVMLELRVMGDDETFCASTIKCNQPNTSYKTWIRYPCYGHLSIYYLPRWKLMSREDLRCKNEKDLQYQVMPTLPPNLRHDGRTWKRLHLFQTNLGNMKMVGVLKILCCYRHRLVFWL